MIIIIEIKSHSLRIKFWNS